MNFAEHEKYGKVYETLQVLLKDKPRLLILGIGENRMGDDGIGPYLSFYLSKEIDNPNILIMNGGIVPEERKDEIYEFDPEMILILDAADIGKKPGGIGLYKEDVMLNYLPISSHTLPLPIFIDRLKKNIKGLKIFLLGIQPISMQFLDTFKLFKEDKYSLDDKEENVNIPFYSFNLTKKMKKMADDLLSMFSELLVAY